MNTEVNSLIMELTNPRTQSQMNQKLCEAEMLMQWDG